MDRSQTIGVVANEDIRPREGSQSGNAVDALLELVDGYQSELELDNALRHMPESDTLVWDRGAYEPSNEGAAEAQVWVNRVDQLARQLDGSYRPGIHQFSLLRDGRLGDEDLKKALFLSQTATVIGRKQWSYRVESLQGEDSNWMEGGYSLDHDLIRDVYRHREAIRSGALLLVPTSVGHGISMSTMEVDLPHRRLQLDRVNLLERLEQTRVLNVDAPQDLVDAFIARYQRNEQLVSLPELHVPWIQDIDVSAVLAVREEHGDELAKYQGAYHDALLHYIEARGSLDFDRISQEINGDIVEPKLKELDKSYRRSLRHHRSLTLAGGALALLPVVGVIVSKTLLGGVGAEDLWNLVPSASAGMLAPLVTNVIGHKHETESVEDDEFYILWRLKQ